jgi:hypothetical protein
MAYRIVIKWDPVERVAAVELVARMEEILSSEPIL